MTTQVLDRNKIQDSSFQVQKNASFEDLKKIIPKNEPPLSFAVQKNALSWVQELIANGASPFTENSYKLSAFDHAVFLKNESAIAHLFSLNQDKYHVSTSSFKAYSETKNILNHSKFIATENGLISQFILIGNLQIVSNYLKNSSYIFDFNPKTSLSSLHIAAMGASTEMIHLLVDHGFSIDTKDQYGRTPLHYAALNNKKEIFLAFLKKGADILEPDAVGVTPLDLLICESKKKDPLLIHRDEKLNTLALLVLTLFKASLHSNSFGSYLSPLQNALYYLLPLSQTALILQGVSDSKKVFFLSSALNLLAQNFTLSRLVLNSFILAKTAISCFEGLKEVYYYGKTRPLDTLQKVSVRFIQGSIISYDFFKNYSLDDLKNFFYDLTTNPTPFFQTKIGEKTQKEFQHTLDSFLASYKIWYKNFNIRIKMMFY